MKNINQSMGIELPCNNCPHNSVCCRWGTFLNDAEGEYLLEEFGADYIYYNTDDKEYRTQVKNGRCMFFLDGKCSIHNHPYYPRVCYKFPWKDVRTSSLPMAYDATLCPEIKNETI